MRAPEMTGHALRAESHTVTTTSTSTPMLSGRFDACLEISTPASAIALTASGFRLCGSVPAEYASISSPLSFLAHPSAIWLRQELPVHRKSTRRRLAARATGASFARTALLQRVRERPQRAAEIGVA